MKKFLLIAREKYKGDASIIGEVVGEEHGINEAHRIYRQGSMQEVILLDESLQPALKIMRKCHCLRVQQYFDGTKRCEDCGLFIDHDGYKSKEERGTPPPTTDPAWHGLGVVVEHGLIV